MTFKLSTTINVALGMTFAQVTVAAIPAGIDLYLGSKPACVDMARDEMRAQGRSDTDPVTFRDISVERLGEIITRCVVS